MRRSLGTFKNLDNFSRTGSLGLKHYLIIYMLCLVASAAWGISAWLPAAIGIAGAPRLLVVIPGAHPGSAAAGLAITLISSGFITDTTCEAATEQPL